MNPQRNTYSKKAGLPPESLIYTGNRKPSPGEIELMVYNEDTCNQIQVTDCVQLDQSIDINKINLLIINNLTDITLIEDLGRYFTIHPMLLEDVLNTNHLPKIEESGNHLLLTLKILSYSRGSGLIQKHLCFLLADHFVIVFKDFENNVFQDIINRIGNGKSKARQKHADYLFYILTDTIIDTYYKVINDIYNEIDILEMDLLKRPEENYIKAIYQLRQQMSDLRAR